jgi:hypothetical protein
MNLEKMFFNALSVFLAEIEDMFGYINIIEWIDVFDEWKNRLK